MPKVEHITMVAASPANVWAFVRDMDNWAPFLTGYQKHTKLSEEESRWFLKGELGGLTRMVEFKVRILKWNEPDNVEFELVGVNEPVNGSGEFAVFATAPDEPPQAVVPRRLGDRFVRWVLAHIFGARQTSGVGGSKETEATKLRFTVALTARGVSGPVFNTLLTPMMKPVAEDLASRIAEAIGKQQLSTSR
jgi:carbon monoxide dehydrogenase subunit G